MIENGDEFLNAIAILNGFFIDSDKLQRSAEIS